MRASNSFKTIGRIILPVIFLGFCHTVLAQAPMPTTQVLPDTARMTFNQISQANKMFVFPSKGQSQNQQKKDEFDCYMWAVEQSGIDPLNLPKVQVAPVQSGPDGSAVRGAARGAAAGVAIGAVAGNAGRGAAIGATAGAMSGVSQGRQRQGQQQQQAQANAAAQEQAMKDSYSRAFSACLAGKGYTIK